MIRDTLEEGLHKGFTTVEALHEKTDQEIMEYFVHYHAKHQVESQSLLVRCFWDVGDPVGFRLSQPDMSIIKNTFNKIYGRQIPNHYRNYHTLLPSMAQKTKINLVDNGIDSISESTFQELIDMINEAMVAFPGLKMRKIRLTKILIKKYLANTNGLMAKYKKTFFTVSFNCLLKNNSIDINETRVKYQHIEPFKIVSRAFNLLNTLTENERFDGHFNYFLFSPEAATTLLKEFANYFKIDGLPMVKNIHFPSVLNIIDNPQLDLQAGSVPFDDEGVQSGENYLVQKGIFQQQITDIKNAFVNNAPSTGNGFRPERHVFPHVQFSNLYIKPSVLPLQNLLKEAQKGILITLIKLKYIDGSDYVFSVFGYQFSGEEFSTPVHFYLKTSFINFFLHLQKISKELKFFYSTYNVGSPYLLCEGKMGEANMITL